MAAIAKTVVVDCSLPADDPAKEVVRPLTQAELDQRALDDAAAATTTAKATADSTATTNLQTKALNAIAALEAADANWANLTAAQKSDVAQLNARATAAIIRLLLRKLTG